MLRYYARAVQVYFSAVYTYTNINNNLLRNIPEMYPMHIEKIIIKVLVSGIQPSTRDRLTVYAYISIFNFCGKPQHTILNNNISKRILL